MWYYYIGLILLCGWVKCKTIDIPCFYKKAFSLMLLRSPNVADFSSIAIIHIIIPTNTEQAWSWSALLKDMKHIIQSATRDQAGVRTSMAACISRCKKSLICVSKHNGNECAHWTIPCYISLAWMLKWLNRTPAIPIISKLLSQILSF